MSSGRVLADMIREEYGITHGSRSLTGVFAEEPVPLTTFVQDRQFLNNPPLSDVQFHAVRHIEQIFLPETYPDMIEQFGPHWEPVRMINFAYIQWGKGSGKDHICRVVSARIAYLLLCLHSPQVYFGMPPQDEIHMLNVASTASQAFRAFYKPLKTMIGSSPWFADKHYGTDISIKYDKHLEAVSGHSEAEAQEGLNLILGVADEISAFRTKEEAEKHLRSTGREPARTAEGILKMIRTSARTRFPTTFKMVAISYPRFKGDAIQQLTQRAKDDMEAKGERSKMYYSGPLPTWEVNPRVPDKSVFVEDYDDDPEMARAMYECKPSLATNRVFRNDRLVHAAFSAVDRDRPPIEVEYYWGLDEDYQELTLRGSEGAQVLHEVPGWQVRFNFADDFHPYRGALYAIHGDMALRGDRAGIAMAHVRRWEEKLWASTGDTEVYEARPRVLVDFVTSFSADLHAKPQPREVQIRWYRKLILELSRRGFLVSRATFDRFQSADTMQILVSRGIESFRLSVDSNTEAYDNLRDVIYDSRLESYYRARAVDELLSLSRLPNGKYDHPPGGSKDEADALAGAVHGALELGGDEGDSPERADDGDPMDLFSVGMPAVGHEELQPAWLSSEGVDAESLSWGDFGPMF